jgi:hypothetical protein
MKKIFLLKKNILTLWRILIHLYSPATLLKKINVVI